MSTALTYSDKAAFADKGCDSFGFGFFDVCRDVVRDSVKYRSSIPCYHLGPVQKYPFIISLVPVLDSWYRPSTVPRLVVAVVVLAVKRVFWRWFQPHVCKKVLERMLPSITDSDSSSSVILPPISFFVAASAKHPLPCSILWGCVFTRLAMRCVAKAHSFFLEAATGSGVSAPQRWKKNCKFGSTVTNAFYYRLPPAVKTEKLSDDEPPVPGSNFSTFGSFILAKMRRGADDGRSSFHGFSMFGVRVLQSLKRLVAPEINLRLAIIQP